MMREKKRNSRKRVDVLKVRTVKTLHRQAAGALALGQNALPDIKGVCYAIKIVVPGPSPNRNRIVSRQLSRSFVRA